MYNDSDSADRKPEEYLLFALAFIGVTSAGGGVILSAPGLACTGAIMTLFALWCWLKRTSAQG